MFERSNVDCGSLVVFRDVYEGTMCLGIPMKIVHIGEDRMGTVEMAGLRREVGFHLVEDVEVGEYVIVHAGFAISTLDEKEAQETLALLREVAKAGLGDGVT